MLWFVLEILSLFKDVDVDTLEDSTRSFSVGAR